MAIKKDIKIPKLSKKADEEAKSSVATASPPPPTGKNVKGVSNPKTTDGGSPSSSSSSLINRILLYLTLVGLGCIGGYIGFSTVYSHRCADTLDDSERRCNIARQSLETRYKDAMEDHHHGDCAGEESALLEEIQELKSRIKRYESLERDYETLKTKHDQTLNEFSNAQSILKQKMNDYAKVRKDVDTHKEEINQLHISVDTCLMEKETFQKNSDDNKRYVDRVIESKTKELGIVEHRYQDCTKRLEQSLLRTTSKDDREEL